MVFGDPPARQLLPNASDLEASVVQRCRRRIQRLQQRQPQKITGRHLFLAAKMKKLALHNDAHAGVSRPLSRQKVMALHGAEWSRLSDTAKHTYELQAGIARSEQHGALETALVEEHRLLETVRMDEATGSQGNPSSMLISQCKLKPEDLQRLQKLFQADFLTPAILRGRHQESQRCPAPVEGPRFTGLQQNSQLPGSESNRYGIDGDEGVSWTGSLQECGVLH